MEDRRREGAGAEADEHVADLRDRRVGEDFLEIGLADADAGGEERRRRADRADEVERDLRVHVERRQPRDHVHAGGDHGGGVDQRGDRRRAGHGVGQPDVERNLRRFAGRADEEQQADGGDDRGRVLGQVRRHAVDVDEGERRRAELRQRPEQQEHADQERRVADAVGDERLAAGDRVVHVRVPEADQQVGAQADAFPTDEQQRQRVAEHEHEHRGGEQVQIGEEARDVGILVHVAERIEMDQQADAGDDQDHHAGQRVDAKGHLDRQRRGFDPGVEVVGQCRTGRAPARAARRC